jgi:hypothetical protein
MRNSSHTKQLSSDNPALFVALDRLGISMCGLPGSPHGCRVKLVGARTPARVEAGVDLGRRTW